jgi:hypothetical protein
MFPLFLEQLEKAVIVVAGMEMCEPKLGSSIVNAKPLAPGTWLTARCRQADTAHNVDLRFPQGIVAKLAKIAYYTADK